MAEPLAKALAAPLFTVTRLLVDCNRSPGHRQLFSEFSRTLSPEERQADSAFSQRVVKVESADELESQVGRLLTRSDLIIAQEFLPTPFDWRVGVFDRQPLFVCKYFMAKQHWQIIKREGGSDKPTYGDFTTLPVEHAPEQLIRTAFKAANLIGDGLYGVDIKEVGKRYYVIEINDNPNIDAGVEDAILREELYLRIMRVFRRRIEKRFNG